MYIVSYVFNHRYRTIVVDDPSDIAPILEKAKINFRVSTDGQVLSPIDFGYGNYEHWKLKLF